MNENNRQQISPSCLLDSPNNHNRFSSAHMYNGDPKFRSLQGGDCSWLAVGLSEELSDNPDEDSRRIESEICDRYSRFLKCDQSAAFVAIRYMKDANAKGQSATRQVRSGMLTYKVAENGVLLLWDIFVDKPMRRRGVANKLIDHVIVFARMKGCSRIKVSAIRQTNAGISLFTGRGFGTTENTPSSGLCDPGEGMMELSILGVDNLYSQGFDLLPSCPVGPSAGFHTATPRRNSPVSGFEKGDLRFRTVTPGDGAWLALGFCHITESTLGFDAITVEAYLLHGIATFLRNFDAEDERLIMVTRGLDEDSTGSFMQPKEMRVGGVICRREGEEAAHLGFLYIDDSLRGTGLGGELIDMVLTFAKSKGYKRVRLITQIRLQQARAIYIRKGFKLVHQVENFTDWGYETTKEFWEREL